VLKKISRLSKKFVAGLTQSDQPIEHYKDFSLFKYLNAQGNFDYEYYKKVQIEGNKKKLDKTWVKKENIKQLADYIKKRIPNIQNGICHGTRQGKEQKWFRDFLDADVIGTEISDTANQFENTLEWDFHEVKVEWIGKIDFIYSNSFDHSYNPELCLNNWMTCISPNGFCILEHTSGHEKTTELDPFGVDLKSFLFLIYIWSKEKYHVYDIIPASEKGHLNHSFYIILKNNKRP